MNNQQIVANRIITPDGTELQSYHVHDYQIHIDKNGHEYMVDGGTEYLRRNVCPIPYTEASIMSTDPHEQVRRHCAWGTRGKSGKLPVEWVKIKDLATDHIENILMDGIGADWMRTILAKEIEWRKHENNR